jgi:hypothetical protein
MALCFQSLADILHPGKRRRLAANRGDLL